MLPAYLSFLVLDEGGSRSRATGGALLSTAAMTLGFVLVFGCSACWPFGAMVLFGASCAIASLGCTVDPFLAVVVTGFRGGSLAAGIGLFLAYAAGMGLVVGAAALAIAFTRVSLLGRLRRAAPVVDRIAGVLLLVVGAYAAWYGWYEVRVFHGSQAADPVVEAASRVQTTLAGGWIARGPLVVAAVAAVLLSTTLAVQALRRARR